MAIGRVAAGPMGPISDGRKVVDHCEPMTQPGAQGREEPVHLQVDRRGVGRHDVAVVVACAAELGGVSVESEGVVGVEPGPRTAAIPQCRTDDEAHRTEPRAQLDDLALRKLSLLEATGHPRALPLAHRSPGDGRERPTGTMTP